MKFTLLLLLMISNSYAFNKVKSVGLIDTGVYPLTKEIKEKVLNRDPLVKDYHGTDLACILTRELDIQVFSFNHNNTFQGRIQALKEAIDKKVDYILYTSSGSQFSKKEYFLLSLAKKSGIQIIVSAGNQSKNLNIEKVYPCQYGLENITCIGNDKTYSNYGDNIIKLSIDNDKHCLKTIKGTSQSAAIYLRDIIKDR